MASCAGVFFFGGCNPPTTFFVPPPCAGFWIQIFEEEVNPGTATVLNATVPNNIIAGWFDFSMREFFQKTSDDPANVPLVNLGSVE